eukprot:TRINITY_DN38297_c0_g1_i1.p1 TRINITY_DN38297_c0_g1~~TRINITY_DN38297_c0_g1_i1.p1  ORF type:complete len:201 (-),score=-14.97 TRINITY_DN38297_c0_g1_i1:28-630(-)
MISINNCDFSFSFFSRISDLRRTNYFLNKKISYFQNCRYEILSSLYLLSFLCFKQQVYQHVLLRTYTQNLPVVIVILLLIFKFERVCQNILILPLLFRDLVPTLILVCNTWSGIQVPVFLVQSAIGNFMTFRRDEFSILFGSFFPLEIPRLTCTRIIHRHVHKKKRFLLRLFFCQDVRLQLFFIRAFFRASNNKPESEST